MPSTRLGALCRALPLVALVAVTCLAASPANAAEGDGRRVIIGRPAITASGVHSRALDADQQLEVEVGFDLQDPAGAVALATAVSTPGTPQYRQYLSPADWIAQFSPAQADVDAFVVDAQASGLRVVAQPASRLFLVLKGTVSGYDRLFATDLRAYDVHGTSTIAASTDVSLPTRAAAAVSTVAFHRAIAQPKSVRAAATTSAAVPCSHYWNQHRATVPRTAGRRSLPTALCGTTAAQVRGLYGLGAVSNGLDGRGSTIAVIDAFGAATMRADLATYSARNGLPSASYSEVLADPATWSASDGCTPAGWQPEQAMDLEAAHAVAPAAALVYVGAADCAFGMDVAMSTVLDSRLATIVSNSWGSTGLDTDAAALDASAMIAINTNQHLQAVAEGIGLYFASGDAGDNSVYGGGATVDFPASSPWVTAVGGTASAVDRRNRFVFSTAWGDSVAEARQGAARWSTSLPGTFAGGAGGGVSVQFTAPAYQLGVTGRRMRASTDVAALASPATGFAVGFRTGGTYGTATYGGTSLATPIVAAEMALADQLSNRRLGFANPVLYRAAAAHAVRDVLPTTSRRAVVLRRGSRLRMITFDRDTSLHAHRGYDLPTGIGELTRSTLQLLGTY